MEDAPRVGEIDVPGAARRQDLLAEAPAPVGGGVRPEAPVLDELLPAQIRRHFFDERPIRRLAVPGEDAQGIGRGIVGILEHVGIGQAQCAHLVHVVSDKIQRPLDAWRRRCAALVGGFHEGVQHEGRPRLPASEQPVGGAVPAAVLALHRPEKGARVGEHRLGLRTRGGALEAKKAQDDDRSIKRKIMM